MHTAQGMYSNLNMCIHQCPLSILYVSKRYVFSKSFFFSFHVLQSKARSEGTAFESESCTTAMKSQCTLKSVLRICLQWPVALAYPAAKRHCD